MYSEDFYPKSIKAGVEAASLFFYFEYNTKLNIKSGTPVPVWSVTGTLTWADKVLKIRRIWEISPDLNSIRKDLLKQQKKIQAPIGDFVLTKILVRQLYT